MSTLAEMSLKEAVNTALKTLLFDPDYYSEDSFESEFGDDLDTSGVWSEVKYESSERTDNGLTAKRVAEYGGEGQGDEYWVVISLSDGETTRYFRKDGWYASYDGGELDGEVYEVTPKQKMITVYEQS